MAHYRLFVLMAGKQAFNLLSVDVDKNLRFSFHRRSACHRQLSFL